MLDRLLISKFRKYASRREEFRLLRSNMFGFVRKLCRRIGALLERSGNLSQADDVFYLEYEELMRAAGDSSLRPLLKRIVEKRKMEYALYEGTVPPTHFCGTPDHSVALSTAAKLKGKPGSPGIVRGRIMRFPEFRLPETGSFDIAVASHTDPGWTPLIALSKGIIIEHGGLLSHASIAARELGIPAVIGANGALDVLHDGDIVEINGMTGSITRL